MKISTTIVAFASLSCLTAIASAQTVASQYPVGQSYVISSSPTADGGVITTTYQPPQPGYRTAQASTLTPNPTVTQYRPQQVDLTTRAMPANNAIVPAQFQSQSAQPLTLPSVPTQPNILPTSPVATHGTVQTIQTVGGVNPYVGFPLPQQSSNRVISYSNPSVNPCPPGTTIPANLPPSIGLSPTLQTVPVTQNYRPVLPVRGLPGGSYVSQGLWGNPRAYVNGQPVRNFWRYVIF